MAIDIQKIHWVKLDKTIHSVYSVVDIRDEPYIKTECQKLVSTADPDLVDTKTENQVSEYSAKKTDDFCHECREDLDTICKYE